MNWLNYPNFSEDEFRCSHCGKVDMQEAFIAKLQRIRAEFGPMVVSSGYRCSDHPDERGKANPGSHAQGRAADIAVASGLDKFKLVRLAYQFGVQGIGVGKTFIHLDDGHEHAVRPAMWTYK